MCLQVCKTSFSVVLLFLFNLIRNPFAYQILSGYSYSKLINTKWKIDEYIVSTDTAITHDRSTKIAAATKEFSSIEEQEI